MGRGLKRIINAAGTMTVLGASRAVPEAIHAAQDILPRFVEIDDLQRQASGAIAAATGAEAGFVTASASAGITLAIAATMTGSDLDRIARLPDAQGMRDRVAVQRGHLIDYGAPVAQAIRLAGASVLGVGLKERAEPEELEAALAHSPAAALYVVSHHTVQTGQIALPAFAANCREHRVPLIVDAASEHDLRGFIAAGADIAIYSAHKFLGGLTAGIVAGRKALVRAAYLQNGGIGRGMKVGKEGIAATIAALETWSQRDHAAHRKAEQARVARWIDALSGIDGLRVEESPDPTGNPITRLRVCVEPAVAHTTAWDLADALAANDPAVMVRDEGFERGYFELDPCNLEDGEAEVVAARILTEMRRAGAARRPQSSYAEWIARNREKLLAWPDRA
jgi:D-glucosaminate-6-phosphate ammonia-lyase